MRMLLDSHNKNIFHKIFLVFGKIYTKPPTFFEAGAFLLRLRRCRFGFGGCCFFCSRVKQGFLNALLFRKLGGIKICITLGFLERFVPNDGLYFRFHNIRVQQRGIEKMPPCVQVEAAPRPGLCLSGQGLSKAAVDIYPLYRRYAAVLRKKIPCFVKLHVIPQFGIDQRRNGYAPFFFPFCFSIAPFFMVLPGCVSARSWGCGARVFSQSIFR